MAACDGSTHYIGIDCFPSGDGAALQAAIDAHKTEVHSTSSSARARRSRWTRRSCCLRA
jgi:hypothetical protein